MVVGCRSWECCGALTTGLPTAAASQAPSFPLLNISPSVLTPAPAATCVSVEICRTRNSSTGEVVQQQIYVPPQALVPAGVN